MSDEKIMIGDEMIEMQLEENSHKLNISLEELIIRYIRRGLYSDDYYMQPDFTREELEEMSKRDLKRDMENGIPPVKNDFSDFIGILNRYESD